MYVSEWLYMFMCACACVWDRKGGGCHNQHCICICSCVHVLVCKKGWRVPQPATRLATRPPTAVSSSFHLLHVHIRYIHVPKVAYCSVAAIALTLSYHPILLSSCSLYTYMCYMHIHVHVHVHAGSTVKLQFEGLALNMRNSSACYKYMYMYMCILPQLQATYICISIIGSDFIYVYMYIL